MDTEDQKPVSQSVDENPNHLSIPDMPDEQTIRQAQRVKEIVKELEEAQRISHEVLRREFTC